MKPTFIINKSSYKGSTLYNIMESNGRAFARLVVLTECVHFEDHDVWMTNVHVSEEHRRQGLATALIEFAKTLVPNDQQIYVTLDEDAPQWMLDFCKKNALQIANEDDFYFPTEEEKEQINQRIAELDAQVKQLHQALKATTDEAEKERINDECMKLYRETNQCLRRIGAPESQMYDI